MDPSTLVPLLYMLPIEWQRVAVTILVFLGSMTVIVAALKAIVPGLRSLAARTAITQDDRAVGILADVLDLCADIVEWCQRFVEVLAGHRAPPLKAIAEKLKRSPPTTVLMIAIALLAPGYACAGNQVRTHAQIADAIYEPILAAKQAIERRAYEQVEHIRAASLTTEEADGKIDALRGRYRPVEGAMGLVIDGYNAYVEAIQKAHADGSDLRTEAGMALLNRWRSLMRAAGDLGIPMPEIPEALRELAP
jgi:hypothetical protein